MEPAKTTRLDQTMRQKRQTAPKPPIVELVTARSAGAEARLNQAYRLVLETARRTTGQTIGTDLQEQGTTGQGSAQPGIEGGRDRVSHPEKTTVDPDRPASTA